MADKSHNHTDDSIEIESGMEANYVTKKGERRPLRVESVGDVDVPSSIDQGQDVKCSTETHYCGTTIEMTLYRFYDEVVEEFEQKGSSEGRDDS